MCVDAAKARRGKERLKRTLATMQGARAADRVGDNGSCGACSRLPIGPETAAPPLTSYASRICAGHGGVIMPAPMPPRQKCPHQLMGQRKHRPVTQPAGDRCDVERRSNRQNNR